MYLPSHPSVFFVSYCIFHSYAYSTPRPSSKIVIKFRVVWVKLYFMSCQWERDGVRERLRGENTRGRVRKGPTAIYDKYKHSDLSLLAFLSRTPRFLSSLFAPFVRHLSTVQAENMTSCPFEGQQARKVSEQKGKASGNKARCREPIWNTRLTLQQGREREREMEERRLRRNIS